MTFDLPGGESTSAALRRVEAERQQALEDLAASEIAQHRTEADLESMTRERFEAGERAIQLTAELARLRADMRIQARVVVQRNAELNSACTELDGLRATLAVLRNRERAPA